MDAAPDVTTMMEDLHSPSSSEPVPAAAGEAEGAATAIPEDDMIPPIQNDEGQGEIATDGESDALQQQQQQPTIDIIMEEPKAPETPTATRKDAIFGRLAQWRKNTSPAVETLITTAQRRVATATASAGGVFASPLSSARLSPAHNNGNFTNDTTSKEPVAQETRTDRIPSEDEEEDDDDDEDSSSAADTASDSGSFVSRSTRTSGGSSTFHLAWAAASVVDSVQTQFRGRYTAAGRANAEIPGGILTNSNTNPISRSMTTTNTQLSRMLSSTQQQHIQTMVNDLEPHQYMMLLGRGMLGVNLKQCYLKNAGVYVDYLVQGGAADQTKHVFVGDLLQKVGSASVEKGTIKEIPLQIANAKRPLHLIWATGTPTPPDRMTAVDVCVALMHHSKMQQSLYEEEDEEELDGDYTSDEEKAVTASDNVEEQQQQREVDSAFVDEKKSPDDLEPEAPLEKSPSGESDASAKANVGTSSRVVDVPISTGTKTTAGEQPMPIEIHYEHSIEGFRNPKPIPFHVRRALQHHATKRNHEGFDPLDLVQAAGSDSNFYAAIQHAFLECVVDTRRFPFLARHFSMLEDTSSDPDLESCCAVKSPNATLMLFCELAAFVDLYDISSAEKRWDSANCIAYKFFLPTRVGKELVPPMFDFHHIAPDNSLRKLETALLDDGKRIPRDVFLDFFTAAMDSLTGFQFLSFLTSPECARMRAYLRNVVPFENMPLHQIIQEASSNPVAKSYIYYIILYLLCMNDKEGFGEHDDLLSQGEGCRVEHAAGNLCAVFFIQKKLLPILLSQPGDAMQIIGVFEQLWEHFVDPNCGALEIAPRTGGPLESLAQLRASLLNIRTAYASSDGDDDEGTRREKLVACLTEPSLQKLLTALADDLLYDYAASVHPKFREHKFHEWLCTEIAMAKGGDCSETDQSGLPSLASGSIKRLLRKTEFPNGLAPHKPTHITEDDVLPASGNIDERRVVAECAVVFGSPLPSSESTQNVQRYACVAIESGQNMSGGLQPEEIPATFEGYAMAAPLLPKPFAGSHAGLWTSADGWSVSIQNFVVPRAEASSERGKESTLFGVSLVFQKASSRVHTGSADGNADAMSEMMADFPAFTEQLTKHPWADMLSNSSFGGVNQVVGIALVGQRNTIPTMRDELLRALNSHSSRDASGDLFCNQLVNILGNFSHPDIETQALLALLEPGMTAAAAAWLDQPTNAEADEFERQAGQHLIRSLPPIPLALLFVTALLEQKIVFTSSRRSLLLSATTALSRLLQPLRWWHLLVPCVPASLAGDLLQYPAPFILGMSTEDSGIMDHIRDLPRDVTLVDLDVGRVILAPSFACDCELGRGVPNDVTTSRALRQQVLFMSQALGNVFGAAIDPETWAIDRLPAQKGTQTEFAALCEVCHEFVDELLAGTASCCYWIDELNSTANSEPTVLFDEDRFFHVKNLRATEGFSPLLGITRTGSSKLAIGLEDFDLVLEVFLRCQSMNVYIGSRDKEEMALAI